MSALLLCGLCCASVACQDDDLERSPEVTTAQPLRPLIYTEMPDLTPRAAAVRERRLVRELMVGADAEDARWGALRAPRDLPAVHDAEALGRALTKALFERDEALWDHVFVSPSSYSGMVHVKPEDAHRFVDELQGESAEVWDLFFIEHISEAPEGGLGALFEFRSMTLGQGRTLRGKLAKKKSDVVSQYWGNVLTIGLRDSAVTFELRVPKVLRVVDRDKSSDAQPVLSIAAPIKASRQLQMFIAAGMHLKPELLRSQEYPFPLAVGNFWRYRRFRHDQEPQKEETLDAMDAALLIDDEQEAERGAGETLLEILSVERYGAVRLVEYRVSYDDQELSSKQAHWLITPRAIYPCYRACVKHIEQIDQLLDYMHRVTPIYQFPITRGNTWTKAQKAKGDEVATQVSVARKTEDVEVPAGKFNRAHIIELRGDLVVSDPFFTVTHARRSFVPGQGVVRQELKGKTLGGEKRWIIEELVEARIMP